MSIERVIILEVHGQRFVVGDRALVGGGPTSTIKIASYYTSPEIQFFIERDRVVVAKYNVGRATDLRIDGEILDGFHELASRGSSIRVGVTRLRAIPAVRDPTLGFAYWHRVNVLAFSPSFDDVPIMRAVLFHDEPRLGGVVPVVKDAPIQPDPVVDYDPDGPNLSRILAARGDLDPAHSAAIAAGVHDYADNLHEIIVSWNGCISVAPRAQALSRVPFEEWTRMKLDDAGLRSNASPATRDALGAFVRALFVNDAARAEEVREQAVLLDAERWQERVPDRPLE